MSGNNSKEICLKAHKKRTSHIKQTSHIIQTSHTTQI